MYLYIMFYLVHSLTFTVLDIDFTTVLDQRNKLFQMLTTFKMSTLKDFLYTQKSKYCAIRSQS